MTARERKRRKIHARYGGRCGYCGKEIAYKDMQVDHMKPKWLDGSDEAENLMPSCRSCNHYKRGIGSIELFREYMSTLHERVAKPYINRVAVDYGIITIEQFDGKFYFEKEEEQ